MPPKNTNIENHPKYDDFKPNQKHLHKIINVQHNICKHYNQSWKLLSSLCYLKSVILGFHTLDLRSNASWVRPKSCIQTLRKGNGLLKKLV